jgi:DnaJ-class molecular chaperone
MANPDIIKPTGPIDLKESVAGEEDPGASLDVAVADEAGMKPGDQAPPGSPSAGENVCARCGGSGRLGASDCPDCGGTGKITTGIGGG